MAVPEIRGAQHNPSGAASLRTTLLLLVAIAFLAGILPAGLALDRWLVRELEQRAQRDLASAPQIIAARDAALHDAMMMHAKEIALEARLSAALQNGRRQDAAALVDAAAAAYHYEGVVIGPDESVWLGPPSARELIAETRTGGMPVRVTADETGIYLVSMVPVQAAGEWIGAAGVVQPMDAAGAAALAGMTHSDVVLLLHPAALVSSSTDTALSAAIASAWSAAGEAGVRELRAGSARFLASAVALKGATAVFARDLNRELAMLPQLRRMVLIIGAGALTLALLLGWMLAGRIARPVRELAAAAERVSAGDFDAPLPSSAVREVSRVTATFADMRRALAARLHELRSANRLLEQRQARLATLQSELIKRERVATSARMAAELAHEIRNPVANIRNCLELLDRRLQHDPEGREFAALAIDELLRMHELAERMLELNRPRNADFGSCDAVAVTRDVIALAELGNEGALVKMSLCESGPAEVAMPADALKQVLLNLVVNARDAVPHDLAIGFDIEQRDRDVRLLVSDNGPGIPPELRERIFDPFFTTRGSVGGIGLGLFLVEGIVRGYGGSVSLLRNAARGACFELLLPAAVNPATQPSLNLVEEHA